MASACALLLLAALPALARVWYVDDAAAVSGSGTSWSQPLTTIAEALALTQAWDFHLASTSSRIDAARFRAPWFPFRDFEGDRRIIGPAPDMGADESRPLS